ncbi:rhomboid family intramembrane serine protease [Thioclava sp. FTW29]|uniref:Rhomboid family intramembrane serine protease n=1 Tax=Thioclava litoralis TaxID=3076557 RepID=A0ABZ1E6T4_9RHOB|nr:rhomboid family intramembrane serine protease [Thioclava sp. FTW29]
MLVLLVLACVIPEAILSISSGYFRGWIYQNFAFWPGLLQGWSGNYPGQWALMFVSYAFLHGGVLHLSFNMLTLVSLGRPLVDALGQLRFLVLYLLSALGGAGVYALLAHDPVPMVGASGALFGLAGALVGEQISLARKNGGAAAAWKALIPPSLFLIGINVVMYVTLSGQLAWQTHLGGFLSGLAVMAALQHQQHGS